MRAYVEIRAEPGADIRALSHIIKKLDGVRMACTVIGHTDIFATLEASDPKGVVDIVVQKILTIRGVASTETMICFEG